jgi:hypothetical protein
MSYYLGSLLGGATHILGGSMDTEPLACGVANRTSGWRFNRRSDTYYPTLELALRAARGAHGACRSCVRSAERKLGVAQPKAVRRRPGLGSPSAVDTRNSQIVKIERMEICARGLTAFAFNAGVTLGGAEQLLLAAAELPFLRMRCTSVECEDARTNHVRLDGVYQGRDLLYCTDCGQVDLWL